MNEGPAAVLRRQVCTLLIVVAAALATGRIFSALRAYDPELYRPENAASDDPRPPWPRSRPRAWPTFGSNDRSRFDAVRALVDEGTWVIGHRDKNVVLASAPAGLAAVGPLDLLTLEAAARQARIASDRGIITEDGWQSVDKVLNPTTLEYYSTKPPLFTLLAAGEYWLLKKTLGRSIVHDANSVVRTIVWTMNVPLLVVYLWVMAKLAEQWGNTDWGKMFVVVAACFGTLVTPFLNTFNNHTVATFTALVALYAVVRVLEEGGPGWSILAGLMAGLTVANETPAAAYAVGLLLVLAFRRPGPTLALFLPAVIVPIAALLICNYHELGEWGLAYGKFGGPWYEYEGSHWIAVPGYERRGIDFSRYREPWSAYALHLLVGHHGWFSLTPIHFLGLAGMVLGLRQLRASETDSPPRLWAQMAAAALGLSLVVIAFYLSRGDRNYGGVSAGPRWLIWLTPFWMLAMLPVADWLGRRTWGRALAIALLAVSVISASYPSWNPWRHPWIYDWMNSRGHIPY